MIAIARLFRSAFGPALIGLLLLCGNHVWAQPAAAPAAETAAAPARGNDAAAVEALIRALEDPAARARLLEVLRQQARPPAGAPAGGAEAGAQADATAAEGDTAPPAAIDAQPPPAPSTLVSRILANLRAMIAGLANFAADAVDIQRLLGWMEIQLDSPESRGFWINFLASFGLALTAASASYWAVRLGLARPHARLRQRAERLPRQKRWKVGLLLAVVELASIAAFLAVGLGLTAALYFPLRTELVAEAIVGTSGDALLFAALARIALRPHTSNLRPVRLTNEAASDIYRSVRRLILWALLGHALFANIGGLRVPPGVFEGLERIWGLIILGMVLTLVMRYRSDIGAAIAGSGGRLSLLRRLLARIWLPVVSLYGISAYLVWALDVYQGAELLVRGGVLSALVLLAMQPLELSLRRWLQSMADAEVSGRTAILQTRLQRYAAVLGLLLSMLVYTAAVVAIGYAWGLDLPGWLHEHLSGRVLAVAGDIAFVGLVCWGLWEGFDLWFSLYLDSVDETGEKVQRSARSRTLLPLLRTSVLVALIIAFLVASLTSFGLDVAPLLATAGVVGIAVGFGAQKLVQDVITGLFMLFQNTVSVGDVVTLADYTGTVERITVRTLEVRDLEGSLHTIPFSSVTTVTNNTRDFAYALFDIGVAYKENTDTVIEVLKQVGAEFELDPAHGPNLMSSLEMFGVQGLGDSSVTIRCRFRVRPLTQWGIRRAFLARVKHRFDELGIEIPFPQRTMHWAEPLALLRPDQEPDLSGMPEATG